MTGKNHDEDDGELFHAVVVGLALEAVAVGLFFACAFVWFGIITGRI